MPNHIRYDPRLQLGMGRSLLSNPSNSYQYMGSINLGFLLGFEMSHGLIFFGNKIKLYKITYVNVCETIRVVRDDRRSKRWGKKLENEVKIAVFPGD